MIHLLLLSALQAAPLDLAVEGMIFDVENTRGLITSGEAVRRIEGAISQAKISVRFRKSSFFDDDPPDTPLRLGVRVEDLNCTPVAENYWTCRTTTIWELYHRPSDTVVYSGQIQSNGGGREPDEASIQSLLAAVRILATKKGFKARLESGFYPSILAPEDLRPCDEPDAAEAEWHGRSPTIRGWTLDGVGQILVVGSADETVSLQWGSGPWLEARRLAVPPVVDGATPHALYHLPVRENVGCVADDFSLPTTPPLSVGTALTDLGKVRSTQQKPTPLFDRANSLVDDDDGDEMPRPRDDAPRPQEGSSESIEMDSSYNMDRCLPAAGLGAVLLVVLVVLAL